MESSSPNTSNSKSSLISHEEDANILSFRRRNKILILSLLFLIILLTLTLSFLFIRFVRPNDSSPHDNPRINQALRAFCYANSDAPPCYGAVQPLIRHKLVSDPNQIFGLSLQAAAVDLRRLIGSIAHSNCSQSLRDALDQIRRPLAAIEADPFVQTRTDEQRAEMMKRIAAAEEDVDTCLDDLGKIGAAAELVKVKVYLNGAGDFLIDYARAVRMAARLQMLEAYNDDRWRRIIMTDYVFLGVCQWVFVVGLFCAFFSIKPRP
ncbi:uncharacterized protein LOC125209701 [Salvia hispanica]|uniref:uncharacterized protein LOC125209701 n=1 Tax=Salvia hispanica TaxID=49212 RepID=UPI002009C00C|nr:uncharacterized protein LOC125209701 [Salvia hispanica]